MKRDTDARTNRYSNSNAKTHLPGCGSNSSAQCCTYPGAKSDPRSR